MIFSGWTEAPREIIEGITISLTFVLIPTLWRLEKHRRASERRHEELLRRHADHDEHLKDIRRKL